MEYEYENAAGERRTINAPMKDAPPERVVFFPDGHWKPVKSGLIYDPEAVEGVNRITIPDAQVFRRVFTNPLTCIKNPTPARAGRGSGNGSVSANKGGAVGGDLCASSSLPRRDTAQGTVANRYGHKVVEYRDGSLSTLDGKPIVDSDGARNREKGRVGAVEDDTPIVDD